MNNLDKVKETIASTLNLAVSSIRETTSDSDLSAWDSLGHVNLMMALEQSFDLQLELEDFPKLNSVPAILDYLKTHQNT